MHFVLAVCGVAYALALVQMFVFGGATMACFDDERACEEGASVLVTWPPLLLGA